MIDETNMSEEAKWFHEHYARAAVDSLCKKHINAQYASDCKEALAKVLEMVPEGVTVGWGDSVTLHQVGVLSELNRRNKNQIFDPFLRNNEGNLLITEEERIEVMRKALTADVFLSGTNAVTLDGKLVSTDAFGNRVAGMIFGPKKAIIVAGANKIVKNLDEALKRIREVAAPINARRHLIKHHRDDRYKDLPCIRTGTCIDCNHPWRICHVTVIIDGTRPTDTGRLNVVLVGEALGI